MFVYLSLFGVINVFIDTIKTHLREAREREREEIIILMRFLPSNRWSHTELQDFPKNKSRTALASINIYLVWQNTYNERGTARIFYFSIACIKCWQITFPEHLFLYRETLHEFWPSLFKSPWCLIHILNVSKLEKKDRNHRPYDSLHSQNSAADFHSVDPLVSVPKWRSFVKESSPINFSEKHRINWYEVMDIESIESTLWEGSVKKSGWVAKKGEERDRGKKGRSD